MDEEAVSLVSEIHDLIAAGQPDAAAARLASVHPADGADALTELGTDDRASLIAIIPQDEMARIIEYLTDDSRREVIDEVDERDPETLSDLLDEIDDDIVADILHELPEDRAGELLSQMRRGASVAPLLRHDDESAGGHMTRAFLSLNGNWTAERAIQYLRRVRPDAETAYYLYVVDAGGRLEGIVSLRDLIIAAPEALIADVMSREVVSARSDMDQEQMARLVQRYDLVALPVVDENSRLVGIVTVDDAIDIVEEEATEDILKLAGIGVKERALSPVMESARRRLPWLAANMCVALLSAFVVSRFESTIAQVAALAALMPVIAGQGGNAGVQTATIVVRGLGLEEIDWGDVFAVLWKEVLLGLLKGTLFGVTLALIAYVWQGNTTLAAIAGLAMFLNMIVASVGGVMIPMTLRYGFKVDPATAAGVFDTMLTDIMGFLIFLGLATLFLSRLQ